MPECTNDDTNEVSKGNTDEVKPFKASSVTVAKHGSLVKNTVLGYDLDAKTFTFNDELWN